MEGSKNLEGGGEKTAPNQQPRAYISSSCQSIKVTLGLAARKSKQKPGTQRQNQDLEARG